MKTEYIPMPALRLLTLVMILAGGMALVSGCFKDLGNYDYTDINEAVIGDEGFSVPYNIRINEILRIEPDITFTLDKEGTGDYSYEWVAVGQTMFRGERFTIGTEKILDYVMKLEADNYILYLKVKDNATGIVYSKDVELNVMSPYSVGWLLAGETDGAGQVDMMSISNDIIFYRNTLEMEGITLSPIHCIWVDNDTWTADDRLYAGTVNGSYKFDRSSFTGSEETDIRRSFAVDPGDDTYDITDIQQIISDNTGSIRVAAIINSRAHIISSEGGLIENSFSFYKDADGNMADFRVADRIICNHRQSGCRTMVFYNTDAKEFCYISGLTIEGMKTLGDGENDEFSWNTKADFPDENGLDFVYAVNSFFSDGQSAAILKGPVSGTYYIYCITANRGEPSITKNGRYTVDNSIAPGFGSSPCYAMTTTYGYLLYASGNTLYGYDFRKSPQQCTVLRTFDAPISYMMVDTETDEKYDDCIYVATYDESRSRSGTLYKMQMVDSPDRIETSEPEKLEDGLLKIMDMYYKSF